MDELEKQYRELLSKIADEDTLSVADAERDDATWLQPHDVPFSLREKYLTEIIPLLTGYYHGLQKANYYVDYRVNLNTEYRKRIEALGE